MSKKIFIELESKLGLLDFLQAKNSCHKVVRGVGIDIVHLPRIKGILARFPNFLKKILSPREIDELNSRIDKQEKCTEAYLAKRWAAKEAIFKATGGELRAEMWQLSILNDPLGKPFLVMDDVVEGQFPGSEFHLSISDEREYCVAICVCF